MGEGELTFSLQGESRSWECAILQVFSSWAERFTPGGLALLGQVRFTGGCLMVLGGFGINTLRGLALQERV